MKNLKFDLAEIGNIPSRNKKANAYSLKKEKMYRIRGLIASILIPVVIGVFFGLWHVSANSQICTVDFSTPTPVEMTFYLPTGNDCANGKPPHQGIVAFAPEFIGDTAILYEYNEDGSIGEIIGFYEIYDTGYGKKLPSGYGSIKEGKTVDVFFNNFGDGAEFVREHGNQVYIQIVKAVG